MHFTPNCKLNIGLRVLSRREDGYHNLSTLFYPVYGLADELDVIKSSSLSFHSDGLVVDCSDDDNLILRTYRLFANRFPQVGPVQIRFRKVIPFGAGLGGGSSDAAHMAIALNELFSLGLTRPQLANMVLPLGADCPFFIYNTPCTASGIGECLTPVTFSLKGLDLLMIKPQVAISTREAYAGIALHPQAPCPIYHSGDDVMQFLQTQAINDFEQTLFPLHPELDAIKKRLLDAGALYASMSGSGSTIFGLFHHDTHSRSNTDLRLLYEQFASMIIFHDTLA